MDYSYKRRNGGANWISHAWQIRTAQLSSLDFQTKVSVSSSHKVQFVLSKFYSNEFNADSYFLFILLVHSISKSRQHWSNKHYI